MHKLICNASIIRHVYDDADKLLFNDEKIKKIFFENYL